MTKTLLIMQGSHPLIRRVELYINGPQPVVLNPGYSGMNRSLSESYSLLLAQGKTVYWMELAADPAAPEQKDLTLIHKIPGGSTDPVGVILVRLDKDKVARLLKTLTSSDVGEAFLMQNDGSIIATARDASSNRVFDQALKKAIASGNAKQGSFLFDWNRTTYTVSYGTLTRIGSDWTYVSAAPTNVITAPVIFVSKLIWTVSFAALLLAAGLAWFASSKIYTPVDRLVRESIALRNKLEKQLPQVKEGFLLQLFQGYLYAHSGARSTRTNAAVRLDRGRSEICGRVHAAHCMRTPAISLRLSLTGVPR